MKPSKFLLDIGRPVAYYPRLRKLTGSTTATIFLCQFIYWTGKERAGDGWIYKTSDEIEDETGLSYKEQMTARKNLRKAGILNEKYARIEHTIYFQINLDKLNQRWEALYEPTFKQWPNDEGAYDQRSDGEMTNGQMAKRPTVISLDELHRIPESTAESTNIAAENAASAGIEDEPEWFLFRGKIAEQYRPYADLYHQFTGQSPSAKTVSDWQRTFMEWSTNGFTLSLIKDAFIQAVRHKQVIRRPGSLTNTARAEQALSKVELVTRLGGIYQKE